MHTSEYRDIQHNSLRQHGPVQECKYRSGQPKVWQCVLPYQCNTTVEGNPPERALNRLATLFFGKPDIRSLFAVVCI